MSILFLSDRYDREQALALMSATDAALAVLCPHGDGVPPQVLGDAVIEALENGFYRLIRDGVEYCLCPGSFLTDFTRAVLTYHSRHLFEALPLVGSEPIVRVVCAAKCDTWLYQTGDNDMYLLPGYREGEMTAVLCDGPHVKLYTQPIML